MDRQTDKQTDRRTDGWTTAYTGRAGIMSRGKHYTQRPNDTKQVGDAENARHEIAGHENAAPDCKGGKCET